MNRSQYEKIFAISALVLSALSVGLIGLVCLRGFSSGASWLLGLCFLAGLFGMGAAWMLWRNFCHQQATLRYLNTLAELDGEALFAKESLAERDGKALFAEESLAKRDGKALFAKESVAKRDGEAFLAKESLAERPPLSRGNLFRAPLEKLTEAVTQLRQRLYDLENLRTGLEVRLRRVQTNHQQIKTILDGIADPILVVNDYGELLLANPSAEALLDSQAKKDCQSAAELIACPKLVELLQNIGQRKTSITRSEEIEWTTPQGQVRHYRATVTKLVASGDRPDPTTVGVVATLRDIGDQKASQKRYAEFVSSVSHEMKTPLAGIKAYVELLADGDVDDPQTQGEFLQMIDTQVDRLQRLVENLLNLARIEAGVVQVRKQAHSLNEILEEAFRVLQPAAEAKQITLEADLSELYLNVHVDQDLLLQATINLLSNAVKYTPVGGRVTLRSRLEDDYARFEVEDTGVGLSEEDCQRVFEKFYRVQKDAQMASGTGLGLPLAKHIVEDVHGGTLTLQSTLGQGSTFRVRLPLLARNRETLGHPSSESVESAPAGAPP